MTATNAALAVEHSIPRVGRLDEVGVDQLIDARRPAIIDCSNVDWRALREWSPASLVERFGDVVCPTYLDLPENEPLSHYLSRDFSHEIKLRDFVAHMQRADRPCYIRQMPLRRIPDIAADFDFSDITRRTEEKRVLNIWIGSPGSKSTLHWDTPDNFLFQVVGRKDVILFPPDLSGSLHPFANQLRLSRTDPLQRDDSRFPKLDLSQAMTGHLQPGEVLFLPQRWWHFMYQSELTMSINCWFGRECATSYFFKVAATNSVGHVLQPIWDIFWLGLLNRPYRRRLSADVPTGKFLFNLLSNKFAGRTGEHDAGY